MCSCSLIEKLEKVIAEYKASLPDCRPPPCCGPTPPPCIKPHDATSAPPTKPSTNQAERDPEEEFRLRIAHFYNNYNIDYRCKPKPGPVKKKAGCGDAPATKDKPPCVPKTNPNANVSRTGDKSQPGENNETGDTHWKSKMICTYGKTPCKGHCYDHPPGLKAINKYE